MRAFKIFLAAVCLGMLLSSALHAQAQPDIDEVVRTIDRMYRSQSSYSRITMEIVTPRWKRTLEMKAWTQGMKKTFIRILNPRKERGVATLRIGNEMWNYLPNAGKVIKIPPSLMMSSWMGSDFTNDDLVRESSMLDDYRYAYTPPADADPSLLYITLTPKEDKPIVWAKITMAVTRDGYIPVRESYYDDRGREMRLLEFGDVRDFGGRKVPATLVMKPLNKQGHTTTIRYEELKFDVPVSNDLFSLRNLRAGEQ